MVEKLLVRRFGMRTIWLVNPYGPIEGENWREYSFNQFGKYLSANGYKIVWWTASFSHHFKKQRAEGWKDISVNEHFIIRLVPTTKYKKNFGLGRMVKDFIFGINASRRFKSEEKPDLIIAAENPLTMGNPSYKYAKKHNIPMIYDQMDIWPEFILKTMPRSLRSIAKIAFTPVCARRKRIYDNLSGAIALGKHYLEFMKEISPSLEEKPNALIYNGIDVDEFRSQLTGLVLNEKIAKLNKNEEIWCVFAGTLGPSYDIETIIAAAKKCIELGYRQYRFIIAGSGPFEDAVRLAEQELDNFVYIGKLLPKDLIPIYGRCDIGLATYSAGSNVDMCDKFYDYTAAGLVVINSLNGEIAEHIRNNRIGVNYPPADLDAFMEAILGYSDRNALEESKKRSYKIGTDFDMKKQNEKLLHVIERVIT